ncbi:MAG TPA: cytochrome c oxidase assembly protein [Caulobacteraceae bacterium]|jgi:cytochrome c oxidase assembly protein subunit 11
MSSPETTSRLQKAKRRTALISAVVVFGMTGAAFAAVPLYKRFCQLTGFDGTVRKAEAAPTQVLDKTLLIRFDANVRGVPWEFAPDQTSQTVKIGKTGLAFFHVKNTSDKPFTAHAAYNVVPESAARYFEKLQCFCFTDQTLQPGQSADFPVVYFVDPKYASDPDTTNEPDITLSYTFFPVGASAQSGKTAVNDSAKPLGSGARGGL